ncbi:DUF4244 domain-containing protein [Arthrobacter crystallopoietes]|uniref:DUF4244 domain-containing protein n=1 Tax=Crystallibacter crystallopoietes TaxID=37928 RepID=A0A1H1ELB7_9MICC|nr:DUF4244 domain-containing protein [Arthrobacter crystallopoietes]SDQ88936.1 Protein of unknown function [Arthrobacter crystallopoietes]
MSLSRSTQFSRSFDGSAAAEASAESEEIAEVIQLPLPHVDETAGRGWRRLTGSEAGMATAEYAIATLAAVGFAGLLVLILRSGEVRGLLTGLVEMALTAV